MGAGVNRAGLAVSALLIAAGLGGCGFTPLYATPGVAPGLSRVQVVAPEGRVGFLLRQDLDDALGRDNAATPAWRLDMQLTQVRNARGLNVDNTAQRYELDAQVSYTLTDLATGKVAHTGQVSSAVSYDSAAQPYAGIAARQDTQDRIAADAAQKIQLDLATWMATRPAS
jgi:LPS-assembly lipoprotein